MTYAYALASARPPHPLLSACCCCPILPYTYSQSHQPPYPPPHPKLNPHLFSQTTTYNQHTTINTYNIQHTTTINNRYAFLATSRWVGFRLDVISTATLAAGVLLAMAIRDRISAAVLALALTHVLQLTGMLQWWVRQTAEVENSMTSVERMLEYAELPQEPPRLKEGGAAPPPGWPASGALEYAGVWASYRPGLPPVLRDLSFSLPAGCSCGVVGRTGSGKSSLMLTLFRLISVDRGTIRLDGVDTASIALDALRRQLAIIPQDPVLFSGSLRSNLDPWDRYDDAGAARSFVFLGRERGCFVRCWWEAVVVVVVVVLLLLLLSLVATGRNILSAPSHASPLLLPNLAKNVKNRPLGGARRGAAQAGDRGGRRARGADGRGGRQPERRPAAALLPRAVSGDWGEGREGGRGRGCQKDPFQSGFLGTSPTKRRPLTNEQPTNQPTTANKHANKQPNETARCCPTPRCSRSTRRPPTSTARPTR